MDNTLHQEGIEQGTLCRLPRAWTFHYLDLVLVTAHTHFPSVLQILDRQKDHKPGETVHFHDFDEEVELTSLVEVNEEAAIEIGSPQAAPRQRLNSHGYKGLNEEGAIEMGSPHSAPRQRLNSAGYKGFETASNPSTNLFLYRGT